MHRLAEVDEEARTAVCVLCGPVGIASRGRAGERRKWACVTAERIRRRARDRRRRQRHAHKPYRALMGDRCERCDFVPEHPSQLDGHHVDGDHANDAAENLRTLCANCHRLAHRAPALF